MSLQTHNFIERIMLICMVFGIVGMFQPWVQAFFGYGFLLLLFATIGFTVISNISPRAQ